jgi:transcriptional regulator of heat shock response
MNITKRQQRVLEIVVEEYINLGEPISSHHIEKNMTWGFLQQQLETTLKA